MGFIGVIGLIGFKRFIGFIGFRASRAGSFWVRRLRFRLWQEFSKVWAGVHSNPNSPRTPNMPKARTRNSKVLTIRGGDKTKLGAGEPPFPLDTHDAVHGIHIVNRTRAGSGH